MTSGKTKGDGGRKGGDSRRRKKVRRKRGRVRAVSRLERKSIWISLLVIGLLGLSMVALWYLIPLINHLVSRL